MNRLIKTLIKLIVLIPFMISILYGQTFKEDTLMVLDILKQCDTIKFSEPRKALELYEKAYKVSVSNDYFQGAFDAILSSGFVYNNLAKYDSALIYFDRAVPLSKKTGNVSNEAQVHLRKANTYMYQGDLDRSLEEHYEGIKQLEECNDKDKLIAAYANASVVFGHLDNYEKQIEYLEKSLHVTPTNGWEDLALTHGDLGLTYLNSSDFPKSFYHLSKADSLSKKVNSPMVAFFVTRNWGNYYVYLEDYNKAISYLNASLSIAQESNYKYYEKDLLVLLGDCHSGIGNLDSAEQYLQEAVKIGNELNVIEIPKKALLELSKVQVKKNDYKKAYEYLQEHIVLKDSLISELNVKNTNDLEAKYEAEKKDKEIIQNQLQLNREQSKNKILGVVLLAISVVSFLLWLYYRQRHRLQQHQMETLKQNEEIKTLEALIKGEENERKRLAQDLHDGINGDLSVIKYKITSLDNLVVDDSQSEQYRSAISMLDNTIEQVRSVSHDLAPPSLQNYSLVEAISQYCMKVSSGSNYDINFQSFGDIVQLPLEKETAVYRMTQELINNSVKHAKGENIIVQINFHSKSLYISVQDDGIGYNAKEVDRGLGLKNVHSRSLFLEAELNVDSSAKGTLTTINVNF